jgi:aminoglycoside 3-N-acetyltransferase I
MTHGSHVQIGRLGQQDRELARATFVCMAEAFGEEHTPLSPAYLDTLLGRADFWVFAATEADRVVGGLTAHTLPMTTSERAEVFLFDIAVAADHRRQGIGRRLIHALRREATSLGLSTLFVLADDEDAEALSFYAGLGGRPTRVTQFEFE